MADAMVEQVRRFNRAVTQRVGALDDRFAGRNRPLGEARVLWETGAAGCEVRALRGRLGLDSGHLRRVVRALEADGRVTVSAGEPASPVRMPSISPKGASELRELAPRSAELAQSW